MNRGRRAPNCNGGLGSATFVTGAFASPPPAWSFKKLPKPEITARQTRALKIFFHAPGHQLPPSLRGTPPAAIIAGKFAGDDSAACHQSGERMQNLPSGRCWSGASRFNQQPVRRNLPEHFPLPELPFLQKVPGETKICPQLRKRRESSPSVRQNYAAQNPRCGRGFCCNNSNIRPHALQTMDATGTLRLVAMSSCARKTSSCPS